MRTCTDCGQTKPIDHFTQNRGTLSAVRVRSVLGGGSLQTAVGLILTRAATLVFKGDEARPLNRRL